MTEHLEGVMEKGIGPSTICNELNALVLQSISFPTWQLVCNHWQRLFKHL